MHPTLVYILIGYALFLVLAYFIQEKFIFKPEKLPADFQYKYDAPFKELFFDVKPGVRINGIHFYRPDPAGLVLYLHGNTRSIKGWAKCAVDFYRYNIFLRSLAGTFSEATIIHQHHIIIIPVKIYRAFCPPLDATGITVQIQN